MKEKKLRIGVLVSGSGTNLQSIIDNVNAGKLEAEIAVVVSNKPDSFALERAKRNGIPTRVIKQGDYKSREEFDSALVEALREDEVGLVCLAGFMRILTPVFINAFKNRVLNIHPALLPSFPGVHAQRQAWEYGVKITGCTVHIVDDGTDTGPIVIQNSVPVYDHDTEETLSARILEREHIIYPEAIKLFSEGRLEVVGRKVVIKK